MTRKVSAKDKKKSDYIILRILGAAKDWFVLTFHDFSPYSRHVICPCCSGGHDAFRSQSQKLEFSASLCQDWVECCSGGADAPFVAVTDSL